MWQIIFEILFIYQLLCATYHSKCMTNANSFNPYEDSKRYKNCAPLTDKNTKGTETSSELLKASQLVCDGATGVQIGQQRNKENDLYGLVMIV